MKKILYMISASLLVLMASCQELEMEEVGISFSPEKVMQVDLAAQEVTVTIEAGDNWTLSGDYDWITPSVRSGKSGDKVTFTLALNTTGKIRAAVYEIASDKLTEKLVIKQIGSNVEAAKTLWQRRNTSSSKMAVLSRIVPDSPLLQSKRISTTSPTCTSHTLSIWGRE